MSVFILVRAMNNDDDVVFLEEVVHIEDELMDVDPEDAIMDVDDAIPINVDHEAADAEVAHILRNVVELFDVEQPPQVQPNFEDIMDTSSDEEPAAPPVPVEPFYDSDYDSDIVIDPEYDITVRAIQQDELLTVSTAMRICTVHQLYVSGTFRKYCMRCFIDKRPYPVFEVHIHDTGRYNMMERILCDNCGVRMYVHSRYTCAVCREA